jgi:hypothetical protein
VSGTSVIKISSDPRSPAAASAAEGGELMKVTSSLRIPLEEHRRAHYAVKVSRE